MTHYLKTLLDGACYGCRACEKICPHHAIQMEANHEGFLYPKLDGEKCVHCGLCSKVCPYDNSTLGAQTPLKVFAAQYKNLDALMASSSGGIFSAVAEYVLEQNGYVAGCLFDENFVAVHRVANDKTVIEKMRGSKYVQSDTRDSYVEIKTLLKNNKLVLFSGTPCQVDGLKKYLCNDYENLITLDLVCHGVPSPKLLSDYLQMESKNNGVVTELSFRNKKRNGWCSQGSIGFGENSKTITPFNCSYYQLFYLKNNVSRKSCYECKYSCSSRVGDITIGDFWGIQDSISGVETKNGFSAILVNSNKGLSIIHHLKPCLELVETNFECVAKNNGNLTTPCDMPAERETIYERIQNEGYEAVVKQDCKYQIVMPLLRKYFPKSLKRFLKKILKGGN